MFTTVKIPTKFHETNNQTLMHGYFLFNKIKGHYQLRKRANSETYVGTFYTTFLVGTTRLQSPVYEFVEFLENGKVVILDDRNTFSVIHGRLYPSPLRYTARWLGTLLSIDAPNDIPEWAKSELLMMKICGRILRQQQYALIFQGHNPFLFGDTDDATD